MESFAGLMFGGVMGTMWPITLIGRASVMFPSKEGGGRQRISKK